MRQRPAMSYCGKLLHFGGSERQLCIPPVQERAQAARTATRMWGQPRYESTQQHLCARGCHSCRGAPGSVLWLHLVWGQSQFLWKHMADIWGKRKQRQGLPQQRCVPPSGPPPGKPWDRQLAAWEIQSTRLRRLIDGSGSMGRDMINKCYGPIVPAVRLSVPLSADGRFDDSMPMSEPLT